MLPNMNFIQWIQHPSHPCPIITVTPQFRINNYIVDEIFNKENYLRDICGIPANIMNLYPNEMIKNKFKTEKFIKFQQVCDRYIINGSGIISSNNKVQIMKPECITSIVNKADILDASHSKEYYFLKFNKIIHNMHVMNYFIEFEEIIFFGM